MEDVSTENISMYTVHDTNNAEQYKMWNKTGTKHVRHVTFLHDNSWRRADSWSMLDFMRIIGCA